MTRLIIFMLVLVPAIYSQEEVSPNCCQDELQVEVALAKRNISLYNKFLHQPHFEQEIKTCDDVKETILRLRDRYLDELNLTLSGLKELIKSPWAVHEPQSTCVNYWYKKLMDFLQKEDFYIAYAASMSVLDNDKRKHELLEENVSYNGTFNETLYGLDTCMSNTHRLDFEKQCIHYNKKQFGEAEEKISQKIPRGYCIETLHLYLFPNITASTKKVKDMTTKTIEGIRTCNYEDPKIAEDFTTLVKSPTFDPNLGEQVRKLQAKHDQSLAEIEERIQEVINEILMDSEVLKHTILNPEAKDNSNNLRNALQGFYETINSTLHLYPDKNCREAAINCGSIAKTSMESAITSENEAYKTCYTKLVDETTGVLYTLEKGILKWVSENPLFAYGVILDCLKESTLFSTNALTRCVEIQYRMIEVKEELVIESFYNETIDELLENLFPNFNQNHSDECDKQTIKVVSVVADQILYEYQTCLFRVAGINIQVTTTTTTTTPSTTTTTPTAPYIIEQTTTHYDEYELIYSLI